MGLQAQGPPAAPGDPSGAGCPSMPGCLQPNPPSPAGEHPGVPPLTSNASQASSGCCLARPRLPQHRQPPEASFWRQPERGCTGTGYHAGYHPKTIPAEDAQGTAAPQKRIPAVPGGLSWDRHRGPGGRVGRPATSRPGWHPGGPGRTKHAIFVLGRQRAAGRGEGECGRPPHPDRDPAAGAAAPAPPLRIPAARGPPSMGCIQPWPPASSPLKSPCMLPATKPGRPRSASPASAPHPGPGSAPTAAPLPRR